MSGVFLIAVHMFCISTWQVVFQLPETCQRSVLNKDLAERQAVTSSLLPKLRVGSVTGDDTNGCFQKWWVFPQNHPF